MRLIPASGAPVPPVTALGVEYSSAPIFRGFRPSEPVGTERYLPDLSVAVAALVEFDRRRQTRIVAHTGVDAVDRPRSVLVDHMPLDTERLHEERVWMALSSTGVPELRDGLGRQQAEWDRRLDDLVTAVRGAICDDASVPRMLGAVVAGLSQRLALDATPRSRRDAEQILDNVLAAAGLAA